MKIRSELAQLTAIALFAMPVALAQPDDAVFQNPPESTLRHGNEVTLNLQVGYAYVKLFNPAISAFNTLHLRVYNGSLPGPTIRVQPGDHVVVRLTNALPAEAAVDHSGADMDVPHGFNVTNLHTHGLHVSPQGNADNVFRAVQPGSTFEYSIDIPAAHPAGTFWYHAHKHGSTALQVSSGMAGALIVEGTRPLTDAGSGADFDTLLRDSAGKRLADRVWLFQQIPYSCNGDISLQDCKAGLIGDVEDYGSRFGPNAWENSGHFTTVNGILHPVLRVPTGSLERWRFIHGGVRETLQVEIARCDSVAKPPISPAAVAANIQKIDTQTGIVPHWEFAADGLTRSDIYQKAVNILQPGYRSDVLVRFAHPGTYCILDEADSTGPTTKSTVDAEAESRKLLAVVVAEGPDLEETTGKQIGAAIATANSKLPAAVLDDLRSLRIKAFSAMSDVSSLPVDGHQTMAFSVDVSKNPNVFQVDGQRYDPTRIDRTLKLNHLDEWTLTSYFGSHPFHIHTNPFQIISIKNPQAASLTAANCPAIDGGDTQYCGLIGVWKDTLFVKQGYSIVVRTRYTDFIGDFVLHCHILDHEDQGMMQNVRILP